MSGKVSISSSFEIPIWYGIAGGITTLGHWKAWIENELPMLSKLEKPVLETVPARVSRRLNTLGKSVMQCCEKCMPMCGADTAVIAVSRHGDLLSMDKIVDCMRTYSDMSPTAFSYSVHNRFSSLVSMLNGFHGVNAAYSSVRDGFPLAIMEAISLIESDSEKTVMVIAYEPEIPETYKSIIDQFWYPHVVTFVLAKSEGNSNSFQLIRHPNDGEKSPDSGTALSFLRAILNKESVRDGFWEYRFES